MKYKRQYLFLQGLLIAGLLATGCGRDAADSRLSEDPAVPVTTASVTVQDVTHVITQAGTLRGNEEVVVKSEIRGMVAEILFEEGAPVQAGAGLVRLDDAKARAEVLNLQAQLQQHRLELENIRKTLMRKKHLLKGAVLSEQEFDDLTTRRQVEEALIAQIQAGLALADEHVKDTRIRAPFDGMASARRVAVGDFVDVGTPLVSVVQVSPVKVELRIFEKYKTSIKSDMDISVTVAAYPGEIFFGTICFVSPEVDPATRTFLIKALIANADRRLSPGMFAQVSMVHAVHNSALIVPWEAVVQLEDRAFVFTVEQGAARRVPVTVLKQFDDSAEVVGKLEPGRQVILEGKFTVNEGDTLAVKP